MQKAAEDSFLPFSATRRLWAPLSVADARRPLRALQASLHTLSSRTHQLGARLPAYFLTLSGTIPESLAVEIPPMWPVEYPLSGTFQNAFSLRCSGRRLSFEKAEEFWEDPGLTLEEQTELHSFSWLGILAMIGDTPQRCLARALISDWMERFSRISSPAWRPDVIGWRLSVWIQAYNFLAKTAGKDFRHAFLKHLSRQYRYLRRLTDLETARLSDWPAVNGIFQATIALHGGNSPYLEKAVSHFSHALETQFSLEESYPWELLEALRLLLDIRSALGWASVPSSEAIDNTLRQLAARLRILTHPDGGLSLLGSRCLPRKEMLELALTRVPGLMHHTMVARPMPKFLAFKTADYALFAEKEAFSPSLKAPFSPMNLEYSKRNTRLLLRTEVQILNDSFHGAPYGCATSVRIFPHLEMKSDTTHCWIRGVAHWHLEGEPFRLSRRLLLDTEEQILCGEETLFSPLGFSTALLFTFLDRGALRLQGTQLSCALPEQQTWCFSFSENFCAELRPGPSLLMEGTPIATKILALHFPWDAETSLLHWGLRTS
ncbi:MAG: hypothetical protein LBJ70_01470 [Holosporales bacterium]|jgi:hypothetical protein|nr:hypothetical protein [Holosporales bacterium]